MKPTAFDNFHPALALVYFAVALVLVMAAPHPTLLALSFVIAALYGVWLRGGRAVARSFAWQLPLLAVIVAVNPLFSSTGTTELFRIGTQAVYAEGYANAATMALLLLCVMQWFANADAVLSSDKIMGTLGGILPTISLMISMIMRLIPQFVRRGHAISNALNACTAARNPSTTMVSGDVFAEEAESAPVAKEAHEAKRARRQKRHAEQNGVNKPARRFSAIRFADHLRTVTTLMGWSMENSLETADSMHCRGWGANRKRTTFRRNHFRTYGAGRSRVALRRSGRRRLHPHERLRVLPRLSWQPGQPACCPLCAGPVLPPHAGTVRKGAPMSAALTFDNFALSYQAAAEAELLTERFAAQPNQDERPLIGPLCTEIEEGSFTLITGATGCGKTTLLRCCKPELAPNGIHTGAIKIFGKDSSTLSVEESASTIGFVMQNPDNQLVCSEPWHELAFGLENLAVSQDAMRRRVAEIAHFFGMNSWLHQNVSNLSGGQKQLLALASALACAPCLLLLDEPTSQLDPVAAHSLAHALFRINRELGITVLATTHAPELMAPYATQRLGLQNGQLKEAALPTSKVYIPVAPTETPVQRASEPILQVRDASFRYKRKVPFVLKGCNLTVQKGTLHAIVGGNGCGKSTLLALAAGTMRPERGRIKAPLRESQGFIPQDPKALFVCDSVAEELRDWQRACGYGDEEIDAMMRRLRLQGLENLHPYDLSGGQQQLLAFAKVLLTHPKLLLLDEVTKGLDTEAKLMVAKLCRALTAEGVTIVMATHDLPFTACAADAITMLFDGEDACTETPSEFFRNNLFYRATENDFSRAWGSM